MEIEEFNQRNTLVHLDHIQCVIRNMTNLSCTIKVCALLFCGGIGSYFSYVTLVPFLVFWGLDAYFLRHERSYRSLYRSIADECAHKRSTDFNLFAMCHRYKASYIAAFLSKTLCWFYLTLIVVSALVM